MDTLTSEHLIVSSMRSNGQDFVRIEHFTNHGQIVGEPLKVPTLDRTEAVAEWSRQNPDRDVFEPKRVGTFLLRYPVSVKIPVSA